MGKIHRDSALSTIAQTEDINKSFKVFERPYGGYRTTIEMTLSLAAKSRE
jgi:hypothetical protein